MDLSVASLDSTVVTLCAGRTKLEPVAIVVLSVIMALASCQMILQGGTRIVEFIIYDMKHVDTVNLTEVVCTSIGNMSAYTVLDGPSGPEFLTDSIVICAVTIGELFDGFAPGRTLCASFCRSVHWQITLKVYSAWFKEEQVICIHHQGAGYFTR